MPHQVYAGSDFIVLPSTSEPYGLVIAEAKRYGVVPIVHLVDGLKDQVADQVDGFGLKKYSKFELDEKLHQALVSWGSNWQKDHWGNERRVYSWNQAAGKWLELLENYRSIEI